MIRYCFCCGKKFNDPYSDRTIRCHKCRKLRTRELIARNLIYAQTGLRHHEQPKELIEIQMTYTQIRNILKTKKQNNYDYRCNLLSRHEEGSQ